AAGTDPPAGHLLPPRARPLLASTAADCSAARGAVSRAARWPRVSPPRQPAVARRAARRVESTPRASPARALLLLRPSCEPAENRGLAPPSPAVSVTWRS